MTILRTSARRRLAAAVLALATLTPAASQAQTAIILDPPVVAPVNQLNLTDIYINTYATSQWLFTIPMRTSNGSTARVRMTLQVAARLATGESFDNAVRVETRDPHFTIAGTRSVTNLDLGSAIPIGPVQVDPEARRTFERVVLPTGRLQAGMYRFRVSVTPMDSGFTTPDPVEFTFTITNPSTLTLLFPPTGDETVGQTPLFQWQYDGARSRLAVYERVYASQSLEEAASGVPMLRQDVDGTSFLYPAGGARPLVPGRTYVWYVEGLTAQTGGSTASARSEIRTFTVSKAGVNSLSELLDQLEQALGQKYSNVFTTIRSSLLQPNGEFRTNGGAAALAEVQRIVEQIRKNPDSVISVTLE
jgi:hypothetical protein